MSPSPLSTVPFSAGASFSGLGVSSTCAVPPATGVLSVVAESAIEFSLFSSWLLMSLALRRPSMDAPPFTPGFSTATKLALTLLTGLLLLDISEGFGERPRLGGEVDWSLALFSNIARRFLTPLFPELADMTATGRRQSATQTQE